MKTRWQVWVALTSVTSILVGAYWDISWHMSIGRDTFWTPAHLAIQAGGVLAALSGAYLIFATTFGQDPERKAHAIRVWGFRGPLGAFIAAWGGVTMAASAPFDNWWHNAYGLDVKILSPPHMVLDLGVLAVALGGLLLVLSSMNRDAQDRWRGWVFFAVGSEVLVLVLIAAWESTYRSLLHRADAYRAMAMVVPFFLLWMARASRHRWGATAIASLYSVLCLMGLWVMPLFAAEPKLGPVYQPITHFVPLEFPLLILFPALVMDFIRQRFQAKAGWQALALGSAFLLVLLAVQWPFADFLVSPLARNRVFGSAYFPYFERPTSYAVRQELAPPELPWRFGLLMAEALAFAVAGSWLGLKLGESLRKVRR